ncbi:potassium channel subfamily K member 6-like [Littorina saxatilis]|uniref:Potassium channel domain-containing protein n=1 Tax=Littorina saxatilis TaxID=31220 RepID=A0AAN9BDQ7_9CAEN
MAWKAVVVLSVLCFAYILIGAGIFLALDNYQYMTTYDEAIYLCVTIVTTIGYGHTCPVTTQGRVFCIFYVLLGIPLVVTTLAALCTELRPPLTWLHHATPVVYPPNLKVDKLIKSAVVFGVGTVVMTLIPAIVFAHTEDNWTYLGAVYFCVISLSTIGFGDMIAGAYGGATHTILVSLWLLGGLVFMAMVVSEICATYARFASNDQPRAQNLEENVMGRSSKDMDNETNALKMQE